jgi:hypothetical protein
MDWSRFLSAPKHVEEAKAMVATEHHGAGHGESKDSHAADSHAEDLMLEDTHAEATHGEDHMTLHTMNTYYTNYKTSHGQHFMLQPSSFL